MTLIIALHHEFPLLVTLPVTPSPRELVKTGVVRKLRPKSTSGNSVLECNYTQAAKYLTADLSETKGSPNRHFSSLWDEIFQLITFNTLKLTLKAIFSSATKTNQLLLQDSSDIALGRLVAEAPLTRNIICLELPAALQFSNKP